MSDDNAIPQVPRRKKRGDITLEVGEDTPLTETPVELADEPKGAMVEGLVMARVAGGYMLVDVAIPEAELARFATKVRPPEMFAIVRSQAERRLDAMCEAQSNGAISSLLRTRGGMYEPVKAMAALIEAIDELAQAFWPTGQGPNERRHSLAHFWRTGDALNVTGRAPTGDDRARLQQLAHHAGGWPGVEEKAPAFGGGAT